MSIAFNIPDDLAEPTYCPVPWDRFRREVLDAYRPPLRAPATFRAMRTTFDQLGALTVETDSGERVPMLRSTSDLTPAVVAEVLKTRGTSGVSPHTVKATLRNVRCLCNIAVDHGYLRASPFRRLSIGRLVQTGRPQGKRHLSRAEIRTLLDRLAADVAENRGWRQWKARRLQALTAVICYTGLRRNEALGLHVADIDLAGRMIHVRPRDDHRLKTQRSAAPVPMPAALVPILETWLAHRLDAPAGMKMPREVPWLFPGCRRRSCWMEGPRGHKPLDQLKAAAVRAGIGEDVTFQQLRRSLATHLRFFGAGAGMVSRILRHSEDVDEAFYHESDAANLRDAVKDLEF